MRCPSLTSTISVALLLGSSLLAQDSKPTPKTVPTPDSQTKSETAPDDSRLTTAIGLQEHFAKLAKEAYLGTVAVTGFRRKPVSIFSKPTAEKGEWVNDPFSGDYPGYEKSGNGSGFVMSADGYILTNRHFLLKEDGSMADLVSVETSDLRHTICDVIATEPTLNLALLKLKVYSEQSPPLYKALPFGNSGTLLAGHWAFASGDPFGPEQFFSVGTITTPPNRDCYQELLTSTYIQSSMVLHPEAYGGPLLNVRGEAIGIMTPRIAAPGTSKLMPTYGIEFAVPSNILIGLVDALKQKKSFKSPWLGFAVMSRAELRKAKGVEAFNAMAKPRFGIFLENTFEPSPAAAAGLKPGDFLVRFDDEIVHTPLVFQKLLYLAGIGAEVELEFFRDGQVFKKKIRIEERPTNATTK